MRMSELLGLRWLDVDLGTGWIKVRQQWTEEDARNALGTGRRVFTPTKTESGMRDIDPRVVAALREHREPQRFEQRRWGTAYDDYDLVVAQPDGRPLDHDSLRKRYNRRLKAAGLPRIVFHDLRHSHATHLRERGVEKDTISRRLGHASTAQTDRLYGHITPKLRQAATAAVRAILGGEPEFREQFVSNRPSGGR